MAAVSNLSVTQFAGKHRVTWTNPVGWPTPGLGCESFSGSRVWTIQRSRNGGAFDTLYIYNSSNSAVQYTQYDADYPVLDGQYVYRVVLTEKTYINNGTEIDPFCVEEDLGSEARDASAINWHTSADNPNPFSFTTVTDAELSTVYTSNIVTITGIPNGSSIVSGGDYRINGGSWVTGDNPISNGDTLQVRVTSAATTGTSASTMVNIGGTKAAFVVLTIPQLSDPIVFPSSGEQDFDKLAEVFGPAKPVENPLNPGVVPVMEIDLVSYYRGGAYVRNVAANNPIPTSGEIEFPTHFYGCHGFAQFIGLRPANAVAARPTAAQVQADASQAVGAAEVEFYWTTTTTSHDGGSLTIHQPNPGVYDAANRYLTFTLSRPIDGTVGGAVAEGTMTLHARVKATGETKTFSSTWYLLVVDPDQ